MLDYGGIMSRKKGSRREIESWDLVENEEYVMWKVFPTSHRQEAFLEYHSLSQRSSSVEDFINGIDKLQMRCGAEEPEEQVVARFLELQPYLTFIDVCGLALKAEKRNKIRSMGTPSKFSNTSKTETSWSPTNFSIGTGSKIGPIKAKTSQGNTPATMSNQLNRCFICHGIWHFTRDCLTQQLATLTDDTHLEETHPIYDTPVEETHPIYDTNDDAEIGDNEVIYPDKGKALITQRVLSSSSTPSVDNTLWLRNNIFRTKCTTKGRVCTLIIVSVWGGVMETW